MTFTDRARAWIYCRVSTNEQAMDGGSLPTQFRQCRNMVDRLGLKLGPDSNYDNPGVFSDPGVSAWKVPILDRPGFRQLWNVAKPGDRIVSLSLDRQFRSVKDFCTTWPVFEGRDLQPVFCRENIDMSTPTGKLVGTMTAVFAEYKSNLISHRVKESHRIRREMKAAGILSENPATESPLPVGKLAPNEALAAFAGDLDSLHQVEMGRVFGYTRVSTKKQTLDAQDGSVRKTMGFLVQDGYEPADIHSDHGISAFTTPWGKRPGGRQLLNELRAGDVVVVTRADRIFRSILDMAVTLKKLYDQDIHIVTNCGIDTRTLSGRQMIQAVGMMANWESEMNSWRAKLAHKNMRKTCGKWDHPNRLPAYMKVVHLPDGRWTATPDLNWLAGCETIQRHRAAGYGWDKVSDLMEDQSHQEEARLRLPTGTFKRETLLRIFSRRNPDVTVMDATRDWFLRHDPVTSGTYKNQYRRDWLATSCKESAGHYPRVVELAEKMGVI